MCLNYFALGSRTFEKYVLMYNVLNQFNLLFILSFANFFLECAYPLIFLRPPLPHTHLTDSPDRMTKVWQCHNLVTSIWDFTTCDQSFHLAQLCDLLFKVLILRPGWRRHQEVARGLVSVAGGRGHMMNSPAEASTLLSRQGFVTNFCRVQAPESRLDGAVQS